ncbi:MAG: Mpo1-like protein [Lysobacterales bacterium]
MHAVVEDRPSIRRIHRLIGQYAESHRHPTNVLIHWICVPIIVWCVLAFAWAVHPWLAYAGIAASLVYYVSLSLTMAALMLVYATLCVASLMLLPHTLPAAAILFVVTWIFQFIGHRIEGKKPSFIEDLQFLLVGPLFLLAKALRRARIGY